MEEKILLYCDIDSNGKIISSLWGEKVIPDKSYDFFTMTSLAIVKELEIYKVAIVDMKLELVLKSAE